MAFRGYISRRAWARVKWRDLRRFVRFFPRNVRQMIRYWWWRQTRTAERLETEAREARAAAEWRFKQMREAMDVVYHLKHPPVDAGELIGSLTVAASELSREGPNSPCEDAWQEGDTGAWNCDLERKGEICWCDVANDLRALEVALRKCAELNLAREAA